MNFQAQKNSATENTATSLSQEFELELHAILDWWSSKMVDDEQGGFYGRMDGFGKLYRQDHKGIILNTRILWTYAAAACLTNKYEHRQLACRAYEYFCQYFWDDFEGGVIWSVDYLGNPADTQKQIYAQAFAIYALSEYYKLTQKPEVLDKAMEIFWLIEKYSFDKQQNGYLNAFARDWSVMDDIRLSEKDANEAKIMNTHLHLLEAYTNFYRVQPFDVLKSALENCMELFLNRFFLLSNGSLQIYFDENWNPKGDGISFGHNIEASWLLWETAEVIGSEKFLPIAKTVCIQMARQVLNKGIDTDGSLFYEADSKGIKDTDRHWWVQAEAVVGLWNAWQLSGDVSFKNAAIKTWSFIKNTIIDSADGEWHWRTDRCGLPQRSENKAGPWKAPYHNSRMCIEMMNRLNCG